MEIKSSTNPDRPWTTDWTLDLGPELFAKFKTFTQLMAEDLYNRFYSPLYSCPAMAEINDEAGYGWAYVGRDEELGLSYDDATQIITLSIDNEPDDEFDRMDPEHEEWSTSSPMQWLKVADFLKMVIDAEDLSKLAMYDPIGTAKIRAAYASIQ